MWTAEENCIDSNGSILTVSRKMAKSLTLNRKSHRRIETLSAVLPIF